MVVVVVVCLFVVFSFVKQNIVMKGYVGCGVVGVQERSERYKNGFERGMKIEIKCNKFHVEIVKDGGGAKGVFLGVFYRW